MEAFAPAAAFAPATLPSTFVSSGRNLNRREYSMGVLRVCPDHARGCSALNQRRGQIQTVIQAAEPTFQSCDVAWIAGLLDPSREEAQKPRPCPLQARESERQPLIDEFTET